LAFIYQEGRIGRFQKIAIEGKMVLRLWESALPKRCDLRSVDEILERDARRRSIIEGWDV
jgi:hypothetical protein